MNSDLTLILNLLPATIEGDVSTQASTLYKKLSGKDAEFNIGGGGSIGIRKAVNLMNTHYRPTASRQVFKYTRFNTVTTNVETEVILIPYVIDDPSVYNDNNWKTPIHMNITNDTKLFLVLDERYNLLEIGHFDPRDNGYLIVLNWTGAVDLHVGSYKMVVTSDNTTAGDKYLVCLTSDRIYLDGSTREDTGGTVDTYGPSDGVALTYIDSTKTAVPTGSSDFATSNVAVHPIGIQVDSSSSYLTSVTSLNAFL